VSISKFNLAASLSTESDWLATTSQAEAP